MTSLQSAENDRLARACWTNEFPATSDSLAAPWTEAKPILIRKYWSGEMAPASRWAEARTLWSDAGLHVLFNYAQHEPLVVAENPVTWQKTIGLWDRDVCEVFVSPVTATPTRYFEFEAAPTGEWLDVEIRFREEGRESNWKFKSGMTVAAHIERDSVAISLFVPWSAQIPKPSSRDTWRGNFFRCVGQGAGRGYVAWQPTLTDEPNFHVPERFGWIRFER